MPGFLKRHQKKIIWLVVLSFFIGGVGLISLDQVGLFRRGPASDGGPSYAASVNGERISKEVAANALGNVVNQYYAYYQQIGEDPNKLFAGASGALMILQLQADSLRGLIQQALYSQAAAERRIRVDERTVDQTYAAEYQDLLARNGIDEATLANYLVSQGRTLADFQQSLRQDIETQLRNAALRQEVVGVVEPSEDELLAYFEAHIAQYDVAEEIRASHILTVEAETARTIRERLEGGEGFAELAKEYSEDVGTRDNGGDLGWFGRGEMVSAFEEAAFALQVGELSEPVETQFGHHIILVTERREAHTPTLAEVQEQVREDFVNEETSRRFEEWYDALYESSDIEITLALAEAYILQQEDLEAGLAAFERLEQSGEVNDPYLPYYIGRVYEALAVRKAGERDPLLDIEEPTEEEQAQMEDLLREQEAYENAALAKYLVALEEVNADEDFVNRVLMLDPDSASARYLLGKLLMERGDVFTAEEHFQEVIYKTPDHVPTYIASGDLAMRQGASMQAVQRYEQALALRPNDVTIMTKLVTAYLAIGYLGEAEETLRKIAEIDPGNVRMQIAEGELAHARLQSAVSERDGLLALAERTPEEEGRLAVLAQQIEEHAATAIARFEKGLERGGTLDVNVKLGQVYLLVGRLDDAEDEFRRVIVQSPYRVDAYRGLAEVHVARDQIEDALEQLSSALARSLDDAEKEQIAARILDFAPDDTTTRLRLAKALGKQYKWTAATREYAAVLEANPALIEAYVGIAEAYRWRNEPATAVEYLDRGLAHAAYTSEKITLYEEMLVAEQAVAGAGRALSSTGQDARIALARLCLDQGRDERAADLLSLVRKDDPAYRADEVRSMLIEAGVEQPPAELDESDSDAATAPEPDGE